MKKYFQEFKNLFHEREGGIAMLFAILISAALLLVALGISQIAYKELTFSIEAKDSDRAFMAADTGIECGLYMDSMGSFTGTSSDTMYCHNIPVNVSQTGTSTFQFSLGLSPNSCAQVYIDKGSGATATGTQIDSYGYNIAQQVTAVPQSCISSTTLMPNLVSRALRITYSN